MKVAVVVPAHNEAQHLPDVIAGIPKLVDEVIVVDDCSDDGTQRVDGVKWVRNNRKLGVGGAIIEGHRASESEVDVVMAGDDQMDPKYLPDLLNPIVLGFDYVKGNRFLRSGDSSGMPGLRVFGSRLLSFPTKLACGYLWVSDPQNGYTALRMSAFRKLDSDHIAKGFQFENDILVHLNVIGAKVTEVPIPARYLHDETDLSLRRFIPTTTGLLLHRMLWRPYRKSKR